MKKEIGRDTLENFDFDLFNTEYKPVYVDICGLVKKMKSKQRNMLRIGSETRQLDYLLKDPPSKNECYKMLSVGGGFSSIAVIKYIADREPITDLYVSTFRIGRKQFEILNALHMQNRIAKARFITSSTQKKTDEVMTYKGKQYSYFEYIAEICKANGWKLKVFDNHSKLILMRTEDNNYICETSSNLNENPKMEQFSFENDKELFDWYRELFDELIK